MSYRVSLNGDDGNPETCTSPSRTQELVWVSDSSRSGGEYRQMLASEFLETGNVPISDGSSGKSSGNRTEDGQAMGHDEYWCLVQDPIESTRARTHRHTYCSVWGNGANSPCFQAADKNRRDDGMELETEG